MIYKTLVIVGCLSLMAAGCYSAIKLHNYGMAIANICIGVANLILMLK